jgi:hypothetical protein
VPHSCGTVLEAINGRPKRREEEEERDLINDMNNREQISTNPLQLSVTMAQVDSLEGAVGPLGHENQVHFGV